MIFQGAKFETVELAFARFVLFGFFVYFVSLFLLDASQQKTIFYLCVGIPALPLLLSKTQVRQVFTSSLSAIFTLCFLIYFSLSAAWAGTGVLAVADSIKYALYLVCLMLAVKIVAERFDVDQIIQMIVLLGCCSLAFYSLMILAQGGGVTDWLQRRSSLHAISGWGEDNPISSAVILGLPVLASWAYLPGKKKWCQIFLFSFMLMGLAIMLLTKSRGPVLALVITLILLSLYRRKIEDGILCSAILAVAVVIFSFTNVSEVLLNRAADPNYRMEIWGGSLRLFADNWLLGQGFGHQAAIEYGGTVATHSHSSLLEILRVGGVVGFALFVLMVFSIFYGSMLRKVNPFFAFWFIYGVLCLATNGRLVLSRPTIEWFAFWLPLFFALYSSARVKPEQV